MKYRRPRREGNSSGKALGGKILWQLMICVAIVVTLITIQRLDLKPTNEALSVFKEQIGKDYKAEEVVTTVISMGKKAIDKPAELYANLIKDSKKIEFIAPTDMEAITVFGNRTSSTSEGAVAADNNIKFVSDKEIQTYAARGGLVTEIVANSSDGTMSIKLDHGNDVYSKYIGCTQVYVEPLQRVNKGDIIASVSNGAINYLSFEVWIDGEQKNPYDYMALED